MKPRPRGASEIDVRTWIALLVALAVIAAVLVFGLGLLEEEGGDGSPENGNGSATTPSDDDSDTPSDPRVLRGPAPEQKPPLEAFPIRDEVGVLLLVGVPQRFNLFLAQQWDLHPSIEVHAWAAPPPDSPGGGPPPGEVLPGLMASAPRGVTLDDEDIDVVVVHDLDPAALERDFWIEVAKRVEEGRLGLLVIPGLMHGPAMLADDALGRLVPVAKARAIEGQPVPGTFVGEAQFVPTDAGLRHPATRLVSWPSWSRRIWGAVALIETPWGTKLCYPVEEAAEGAEVLLRAKHSGGDEWPAAIAGDPSRGRVLWFGGWDLGSRHAYGRPDVVKDWQVLVRNWIAWLSEQAE